MTMLMISGKERLYPDKPKMNRRSLWIALLILICYSCGSKNSVPADKEQKSEEPNAAVQVRDKVLQSLRSSGVTEIIHSSESRYNPEVANDVNRIDRYLVRNNKGAAAA